MSGERPLTWAWIVEEMTNARNYWIATARPNATPHTAPVWGVMLGDELVTATAPTTVKARNLAHNPSAVVHLESGDRVVIVEGQLVIFTPTPDQAAIIDDVYAAKYGIRPNAENSGVNDAVWLRLVPRTVHAWLEQDFLATQTRFAF